MMLFPIGCPAFASFRQNRKCLVCSEVCPFHAIEPNMATTAKGPAQVPVVREDLCVGCGMCEYQCPVFDRGAIEVYRFGERRLASGNYASDERKRVIDSARRNPLERDSRQNALIDRQPK